MKGMPLILTDGWPIFKAPNSAARIDARGSGLRSRCVAMQIQLRSRCVAIQIQLRSRCVAIQIQLRSRCVAIQIQRNRWGGAHGGARVEIHAARPEVPRTCQCLRARPGSSPAGPKGPVRGARSGRRVRFEHSGVEARRLLPRKPGISMGEPPGPGPETCSRKIPLSPQR